MAYKTLFETEMFYGPNDQELEKITFRAGEVRSPVKISCPIV